MYKHFPSRNQRSKGVKVKQILQICILVAITFWLIYQVKHSQDKKKEFQESDLNTSLETNFQSLNFGGRKGIQDSLEKKPLITKINEEIEKEEIEVEEEDSKHEEEEQEEDNENEEKEKKYEEIDDHEVDILEEERDREEGNENEEKENKNEEIDEHEVDILDEEGEREEGNENEEKENKNENENENENAQNEDLSHVEDHDHEAREEQYKGDDASSAVAHESESVSNVTVKGNLEKNIKEMENAKDEIAENVNLLNVKMKEEEKFENVSSKKDEMPVSNSTSTMTNSNDREENGNDLVKNSIKINDTPMMNSTQVKLNAGRGEISTKNPSLNNTRSGSNAVDIQNMETVKRESSNSSTTSKTDVLEKEKIDENFEKYKNGNLKSEKEMGENENEEGDFDRHDPIDISDSNVSLLGIRTEGSKVEEVAAE